MNRRRFILQTAAAVVPLAAQSASERLRIIDTHVHFYDPTRPQGVPWLPPASPIHRRTLPADHLAALGKSDTTRGVIKVEASAWLEDNQWVLDLAAHEPLIVGGVGRLAPGEVDFARHVKRFAANPLFRGIRSALPKQADNPAFLAGLRTLADAGLSLDVNANATLHPVIASLAARFPDLHIVLNHLGAPGDTAAGLPEPWREGVRLLGAQRNVFCKVSAVVEQAKSEYGRAPTDLAVYRPILDTVWESFGAERLLYGSNWPVCERGAALPAVEALALAYFSPKGAEVVDQVFWRNSQAAYRWTRDVPAAARRQSISPR
jgi:predicted TIM-barrel fold metal-dependent hydrolase